MTLQKPKTSLQLADAKELLFDQVIETAHRAGCLIEDYYDYTIYDDTVVLTQIEAEARAIAGLLTTENLIEHIFKIVKRNNSLLDETSKGLIERAAELDAEPDGG